MTPTKNEGSGVLVSPRRNNFFYGKLMDVTQFEKDHRYFNFKRSLLNRLVLGSGVVCGLDVTFQGPQVPGRVLIQPGVAIDGLGREIIVPEAVSIDPHQLTDDCGHPAGPRLTTGTVTICLAYAETCTDLVPVLVPDCDTPGNCAPSTIHEGFCVIVRPAAGNAPAPPSCQLGDFPIPTIGPLHDLLCKRSSAPCPEPPETPCVPLARITLPLTNGSINTHAGRRLVYGNALLYELIVCLAERVGQVAGRQFLRYVAGDGQSGHPGEQLQAPLIVELINGDGNHVPGVHVEFEATDGGTVTHATSTTDQNGGAQTRWTLGPQAGEQQVIVRAVGTAFTVTFRATAVL